MGDTFSDNIIIFTDGSCTNNGKMNAKAGIGIHFPNGEYSDISMEFLINPITNQRAELYAIYKALVLISQKKKQELFKVTIYSDSIYSIKSLTKWYKKWEKNNWMISNKNLVKNLDIIKPTLELIEKFNNKITFIYTKGHSQKNNFMANGNRLADRLACDASKR